MADTIRRRMQRQDEFTDEQVEPAVDAYRRYDFRSRVRRAWRRQSLPPELAIDLGISPHLLDRMLAERYFGSAWACIEAASPFLTRRRVRFSEVPDRSIMPSICSSKSASPTSSAISVAKHHERYRNSAPARRSRAGSGPGSLDAAARHQGRHGGCVPQNRTGSITASRDPRHPVAERGAQSAQGHAQIFWRRPWRSSVAEIFPSAGWSKRILTHGI